MTPAEIREFGERAEAAWPSPPWTATERAVWGELVTEEVEPYGVTLDACKRALKHAMTHHPFRHWAHFVESLQATDQGFRKYTSETAQRLRAELAGAYRRAALPEGDLRRDPEAVGRVLAQIEEHGLDPAPWMQQEQMKEIEA